MSHSVDFNGQCPSCGHQFASSSGVLQHMNSPITPCVTWFKFLESLSTESTSNNEMDDDNNTSNHHTLTATHFKVSHPNPPSIFQRSRPGFMDDFNADHNAEKRKTNIYYPFSSKEEWGLSLWLLCSRLSMGVIDDFLALPIIRHMTNAVYSPLNET